MSFGDWLENAALDWAFGGTDPTRPSVRWVGLTSAAPGDTGAFELVDTGYGRVTGSFSSAVAGSCHNNVEISWTNGEASAWTTASGFGVWDAETNGNYLGGYTLNTAKTIGAGDTAKFSSGALTITLTQH